jgi:DNA-binding XRE family transcriptional regulator
MNWVLRQRNGCTSVDAMSRHTTSWFRWLVAIADRAGDITQQDIAQRLGVSKSTVTAWAQGTLPSPDVILKAAAAYGVSATELFEIAYVKHEEPKNPPVLDNERRTAIREMVTLSEGKGR